MCNALSMSINSATTSKMKRILGRLSYVSEVGRKRINTIRDHNSSVKTLRPTSSREEYAQSALAQRNIFSFMSKEQLQTPPAPLQIRRYASNLSQENCNSGRLLEYLHFHQETSVETREAVSSSFVVLRDFVTEEEEKTLLKEVEPHLKRLHYEHDHWDDAIHGFRETERSKWGKASSKILAKLQEFAFPNQDEKLALVHILDLAKTGVIKPHVDSIRGRISIQLHSRGPGREGILFRFSASAKGKEDLYHVPQLPERGGCVLIWEKVMRRDSSTRQDRSLEYTTMGLGRCI
ncbi:uncharacterized protein LOC125046799 isoform X3 [Penaeus chinensis]|uniref:uncharacterized protein LOC125046799 isoform X3 n=1 Tax=Penaeus chinensis TaxID=139456 RepID=UPI001FB5B8E2|nr:uncharacterized protein LOC125046799 isoform X3 [Penaeus chinensis]